MLLGKVMKRSSSTTWDLLLAFPRHRTRQSTLSPSALRLSLGPGSHCSSSSSSSSSPTRLHSGYSSAQSSRRSTLSQHEHQAVFLESSHEPVDRLATPMAEAARFAALYEQTPPSTRQDDAASATVETSAGPLRSDANSELKDSKRDRQAIRSHAPEASSSTVSERLSRPPPPPSLSSQPSPAPSSIDTAAVDKRLTEHHPAIAQALNRSAYRFAVHQLLQIPSLRTDEAVLAHIRQLCQKHAYPNHRRRRLSKDGTLRSKPILGLEPTFPQLEVTDLSLRLGMPPAGYKRGQKWEKLHASCIHEKGRLPNIKNVMKAIHSDLKQGTMLKGVERQTEKQPWHSLSPEYRTSIINDRLSGWVQRLPLHGVYTRGVYHFYRRPPPPRQDDDPQDLRRSPANCPPTWTTTRSPLLRLMRLVQKFKARRQFKPDRVTANIVLKCWLFCLDRIHKASDGPARKRQRQLAWSTNAKAILEQERLFNFDALDRMIDSFYQSVLTSSDSLEIPHPNHPFTTADDSPLSFDRHIRPLAKSILKAVNNRGDSEGRRKTLVWMSEMQTRMKRHEEQLKKRSEDPSNGEDTSRE